VNIDVLGISELKWTGMGEFNSNDHYIYYCGQEFLLWLSLFVLPGAISNCYPLFPSSILYTFPPGGLIFQCHNFLPLPTVHGVLTARILEWFAILSSSGPHFVRTLHHDPCLGCLYMAWLTASLSYTSPFTMTRL